MGSFSLMHWIVVLAIILILFGAGKLPRVMGDFAKGIKAFKSGMREDEEAEAAAAAAHPAVNLPPTGTVAHPTVSHPTVPNPTTATGEVIPASVIERPRQRV